MCRRRLLSEDVVIPCPQRSQRYGIHPIPRAFCMAAWEGSQTPLKPPCTDLTGILPIRCYGGLRQTDPFNRKLRSRQRISPWYSHFGGPLSHSSLSPISRAHGRRSNLLLCRPSPGRMDGGRHMWKGEPGTRYIQWALTPDCRGRGFITGGLWNRRG